MPSIRFVLMWCCLLAGGSVAIGQTQPDTQSSGSVATPAAAPQASAQPPAGSAQPVRNADGSYTIRRTTRLVVLDVVVTDAKGHLVTNLKKDDFHVTESNDPQTIQYFGATGANPLTPDASITSTAQLDQVAPRTPVNIVLLDEFNTRFEDMAFARYSLKKFLEREPAKLTTPTMLLAVDLEHFTVLKDYTQDRQAILDALDHHFAANPWRNTNGSWASERLSTAFTTLLRVAEATEGHVGHKNMIWIGRGFPALPFDRFPIDAQQRVESIVQQCVNMLRDARVTLYSIDPAGVLIDPAVYGSDAALNDPFGGNYQFDRLARATGGRALYGRNDVDAEIATSIRDGESFYTLTYHPTDEVQDLAKFRRIKVMVDRPGLTASTREGYYLARPPGLVDPVKPSRRLAFDIGTAASSTMVYDAVPITVTPAADSPDEYIIHLDPRGIAWMYATDTKPRYAQLVVMAAQFDKKGKNLGQKAKSLEVAATGAGIPPTGPLSRAIDVHWKLERKSSATRVRFVVRMSPNGRMGTADVDLMQAQTAAK